MLEPKIVTIEKGLDAGKTFRIRQMPASKTEEFAGRALAALLASPSGISPEAAARAREAAKTSNGAALLPLLASGFGGVTWENLKPLLDLLTEQIDVVPNPQAEPGTVVPLKPSTLDAHIADFSTLLLLRGDVLQASLGFFQEGNQLIFHTVTNQGQRDS